MKPNQLKYGSVEHIRVRLRGSSLDLQKGEEVDIRWSEEARSYLLRGAKGVARVEPTSRADEDTLHEICVRNLDRVVWIADIQDEEILVQAHTFQLGLRLGIRIGIDEQAVEKARKINQGNRTPKDLVNWLEDQCLLPARTQWRGPGVPFGWQETKSGDPRGVCSSRPFGQGTCKAGALAHG